MPGQILPELEPLLFAHKNMPKIDYSIPVAEIRETARQGAEGFRMFFEPIPDMPVEDRTVPGPDGDIPVRIYRPEGATGVLMYFHGGGWWLGDLDAADPSCRKIAEAANLIVVSVDYRLGPEHLWPAGPEDCYAATVWAAEHLNAEDLSIGGQSAGGNLAAVVALMCRDRGGPRLRAQWLDVPATDLSLPESASLTAYGSDHGLDLDDIYKCVEFYVPAGNEKDPYVSPMYADDLSGLPPAIVTVAELDPLRDQGEAYAKRLEDAGVPVELTLWDGHLHATMGLSALTSTAFQFIAAVANGLTDAREKAKTVVPDRP